VPDIPEKAGELAYKLLNIQGKMTWDRHGQMALDNAHRNAAHFDRGESLTALRGVSLGEGDSAVVIAAGPSVKRKEPAKMLREMDYRGAIIATESAISYSLRNGIIPHLAVTIDPHATRVVRWLGDPELTEEKLKADDYFSRQDQDDAFASEMRANDEILELVNKHGKDINMALSTMASEALVNRVLESGMNIFWWNPMLDDPDAEDSITAQLMSNNNFPTINAGGNVGTASWMMADVLLEKKHVALTGVDFSYYDDTPYFNTQYYYEAVELVGEENLDALFVRIFNSFEGAWFYTDPAYLWYRECFLEMVQDADCETFNCTEGGIVFGDGITVVPLREFLLQQAGGSLPPGN
jgi:hypothetical protein